MEVIVLVKIDCKCLSFFIGKSDWRFQLDPSLNLCAQTRPFRRRVGVKCEGKFLENWKLALSDSNESNILVTVQVCQGKDCTDQAWLSIR